MLLPYAVGRRVERGDSDLVASGNRVNFSSVGVGENLDGGEEREEMELTSFANGLLLCLVSWRS